MQPAPEPSRLRQLQQRWIAEERAIATLLIELEDDLGELQRDVAFERLCGQPAPLLLQRCTELAAECDALSAELAHVRAALRGIGAELSRTLALPPFQRSSA